jgi:hypothetical protein
VPRYPGDGGACDPWEDEADPQRTRPANPDYWKGADPWIAEQRKTRKLPD